MTMKPSPFDPVSSQTVETITKPIIVSRSCKTPDFSDRNRRVLMVFNNRCDQAPTDDELEYVMRMDIESVYYYDLSKLPGWFREIVDAYIGK